VQNDAILVKKDSTITSLQELKGKKLGIVAGSVQWKVLAREILAKNNLVADKDVTLVELALGVQAQALSAGQVDAILTVEPVPSIVKAKGIGKELVDHAAARFVANPFYSGVGVIRADFAKENPTTTKKLLAVVEKAINEINSNPDAARQYLKGHTSLDESMITTVPISRFKMYSNLSPEDKNAMKQFYDIFTKYKVVDGAIDFQKLLYAPPTNK
jgi:NitT/TauT family transport system substrate-binding protein